MKNFITCCLCLIVILLSSCSTRQSNTTTTNTTLTPTATKPLLKENTVLKPNYVNKRLISTVVEKKSIQSDGAKLVHKAQIKYAPNKVLNLEFYCLYKEDGIHVQRIYVKSNMHDNVIEIYDSTAEDNGIKDVISDIVLEMHDYRTLDIYIGEYFTYANIEKFIDTVKYPNEIQLIIENHPKIPDISNVTKVVIGNSNGVYKELEQDDAKELVKIYKDIKDNDFFDNGEEGRLNNTCESNIYIFTNDNIYLYRPLMDGRATIIEGAYYRFGDERVFKIMQKYVPMEKLR